ncbi:dTDP-4-dehydrorhamnose reductase [Microvirga aerilata]|uniref:dTDP-4-dehydrorhamnose reductase n=1 Tax=Microvirga aerilata TaxID=670292 RepID=A0A936ZAV4_9HYPH|nr:dTDP-4-dehydrorhamnose reductase [Microvirga aerilata]
MILVFGSGGQLGQELAALARQRGLALRGLTRAQVDIANPSQVENALAEARPSVIINAGAYTKVDRAEAEPAEAMQANATGPGVLAKACAAAGLPLIHVSTDYVFDGSQPGTYRESDPIAPLGVYGRSKAAGEHAIREILSEHVIVRTSWVYGVYGANFLKTILRLAGEREELRIVADQRGCPTSTADLAEALLAVAQALGKGRAVFGTYHFAGSGATTWHGFAQRIVAAQQPFTGRFVPVLPIRTDEYPTPAQRPANSELDSSRFSETFGYTARPWADAVDHAVEQLLAPLGTTP